MAKLIIIVDVDGADPVRIDPHETAADILTPYEDHRAVNQHERGVSFIDAQWMTEPAKPTFTDVMTGPDDIDGNCGWDQDKGGWE